MKSIVGIITLLSLTLALEKSKSHKKLEDKPF